MTLNLRWWYQMQTLMQSNCTNIWQLSESILLYFFSFSQYVDKLYIIFVLFFFLLCDKVLAKLWAPPHLSRLAKAGYPPPYQMAKYGDPPLKASIPVIFSEWSLMSQSNAYSHASYANRWMIQDSRFKIQNCLFN